MKKLSILFLLLFALGCSFGLLACSTRAEARQPDTVPVKDTSAVLSQEPNIYGHIFYDKETKIQYLKSSFVCCMLIDRDGKPLLYTDDTPTTERMLFVSKDSSRYILVDTYTGVEYMRAGYSFLPRTYPNGKPVLFK